MLIHDVYVDMAGRTNTAAGSSRKVQELQQFLDFAAAIERRPA